jgi:hypothetical protein
MIFSPKKPEPEPGATTSKTYRNQSSHQQPELPKLAVQNFKPRTRRKTKPVAKPKRSNPIKPGLATLPNLTNNLNAPNSLPT